ncbi:hypothetical protein FPV67DRAFT_1423604 [Lyophyllum atratum]|nr:hypothetical protein FPV67DRAFT_1423604 [Lyophyllum atratum]
MSCYTPASRYPTTFAYSPAPLTTPRDRYLAALAEAKAAETEYLAAEAVQREEDALRRRLEDIQLQKQDQELLLRSRYGRTPHHSSHSLSELGAYPTYGYDRLAALRRQVEEEEAMRLLAVRQAEIEQERRRKEKCEVRCYPYALRSSFPNSILSFQNPAASAPPKAPEASLREQLESRLNQEYSSEVRDTIQAIFASLQDAEPNHIGSSSAASNSAGSSKGKAKAAETPATASPSATSATSKDVVNSMNEVHNIEAAFQALESDFTFPAHLDFLAAHLATGSPASSDSEASATVHLAYTSRNHPVRFYEQALSALLTQLDSIDSFGNDDLRGMRKEVVDKVEKALGELEREVEGRWRTRLSKEVKPVEAEVTKSMVTQAAIPSQATSSQSDSAAIPDVHKVPVASAAGEDSSTLSPVLEATPEVSAPAVTPSTTSTTNASTSSEASVIDSTISTHTPTEISETNEDTIPSSTSLAASVLTVKGYDAEATTVPDASPPESESGDTFLLAAADADSIPKRSNHKGSDDAGSDWSEVEA